MRHVLTSAACMIAVASCSATQHGDFFNPEMVSLDANFTAVAMDDGRFASGNYNALDLVYQVGIQVCGRSNLQGWSTGARYGGSSPISCSNGVFNGKNYAPCMDSHTAVLDVTYGANVIQSVGTPRIFEVAFTKSAVVQSGSQAWSQSTSNQYQWSWSNTVSMSTSLEVSASIPAVCAVKESISATISATLGGLQSKTTTETHSIVQNYAIPAGKCGKISMTVAQRQFDVAFNENVQIKGNAAIWCQNARPYPGQDQNDLHNLWFPTVRQVFPATLTSTSDVYHIPGKFHGVQGSTATLGTNVYAC